jgi:hypothetical protein
MYKTVFTVLCVDNRNVMTDVTLRSFLNILDGCLHYWIFHDILHRHRGILICKFTVLSEQTEAFKRKAK